MTVIKKTTLLVLGKKQKMYVIHHGKVIKRYSVSTSKYGVGNKEGSNKTPLGWHRIKKKIGSKARPGEVFINRRRTGKIAENFKNCPDLITSRILFLEGLEPGVNKGKGIDSFQREIYIHGTAEEHLIGKPASHGCIRMKNRDIIELFDKTHINSLVWIIL